MGTLRICLTCKLFFVTRLTECHAEYSKLRLKFSEHYCIKLIMFHGAETALEIYKALTLNEKWIRTLTTVFMKLFFAFCISKEKKEPVQGIKTFRVNNFFPLTQNHKRQASYVLIIDNKGKIMEKTRLHGALTGRYYLPVFK